MSSSYLWQDGFPPVAANLICNDRVEETLIRASKRAF